MTRPSWRIEQAYWSQGISGIAGLDEVGMGALAGPVIAGAVIFDRGRNDQSPVTYDQIVIRDSKTLSPSQREKANTWIREHALAWATGEATVAEIDELNIRQAGWLAMRRAVHNLPVTPELLLVDGRGDMQHPEIPAEYVIKGDALSFSIAAASIVAKVHRDGIMMELAKQFPDYGFERHKGYGSEQHLSALAERGASVCHRAHYAPVQAVLDA